MPSEDATVTAEYGVAFASGMQFTAAGAADPDRRGRFLQTVAEPKHFFGYDLEGSGPSTDSGRPAYHASCDTAGSPRWQTVTNSGNGNTTANTCRCVAH